MVTKRKELIKAICFTLSIICSIMLIPIALAGNDDGNEEEVSVWWIEEYPDPVEDLEWAEYTAKGFYDGMNSRGDWTKRYNKGNDDAWEVHFEKSAVWGWDSSYVDDVDFVWFDGHGSPWILLFEDDHDGDGSQTEGLYNTEANWGDKDLEWIVCSACSVLQENGVVDRWGEEAFHGLHTMLGFHTGRWSKVYWVLWPIWYRSAGDVYAQFMLDNEYSVVYAWEVMTKNWQPSDVYGAYLSVQENEHEYLPGINDGPEDDVDDPEYFEYSRWQC